MHSNLAFTFMIKELEVMLVTVEFAPHYLSSWIIIIYCTIYKVKTIETVTYKNSIFVLKHSNIDGISYYNISSRYTSIFKSASLSLMNFHNSAYSCTISGPIEKVPKTGSVTKNMISSSPGSITGLNLNLNALIY